MAPGGGGQSSGGLKERNRFDVLLQTGITAVPAHVLRLVKYFSGRTDGAEARFALLFLNLLSG